MRLFDKGLVAAAVAVSEVAKVAVTVVTAVAAAEDNYDNENPDPAFSTYTIVITKQTHTFQLLSSDSTQYAKRSNLVQEFTKKDLPEGKSLNKLFLHQHMYCNCTYVKVSYNKRYDLRSVSE